MTKYYRLLRKSLKALRVMDEQNRHECYHIYTVSRPEDKFENEKVNDRIQGSMDLDMTT